MTELYTHVKKLTNAKFNNVKCPSLVWFSNWFKLSYKKYSFAKLRTDVCNTCAALENKISNSVGLEKQRYQKLLELHKADAANISSEIKVIMQVISKDNATDELEIWAINADFIANLTLPHKRNKPNDFHWVGGLKVRPLMITHPGLKDAFFCYFWNETEGNKGASSVRVLCVTVDNCAGNYKNNILLQYIGYLILTAKVEVVVLHSLIVGHTYMEPDRKGAPQAASN